MSLLPSPAGGTTTVYAGRFDFEDGGTYCGGWEDGKAHGFGVCTGPKSMGEFSGLWQFGYEVSGIYIWPSGNCYLGQWMSGKRHGLGVEKKQRWIYKGEWSQGFKGRYGVRISEQSGAKYEGTWANGLQDGYGSETYADGGTFFGQMSQGMRNGYGIRKSVSYGVASRYRSKDVKDSLTSLRSEEGDERVQRERDRRFDENRGGFVLRARSDLTEEVAAGLTSSSALGGANTSTLTASGNIIQNAISGLLTRTRRNSLSQNQDRRVSLRKAIMSKLKKQKSVGDIDEIHAGPGGAHGGSQAANLNTITSSSGRAHKKSSFRSTSSNNSVDSRASNRTAPAGIGLNSPSLHHGGHHHHHHHHHNQQINNNNNNQLMDDGEHSFISQDEITDVNCIEVYMGEWKQDKRTGFGIAERSDGLKYEGEWFNNKKNGYGVTTFKDGTKEEGKYKNNVLATDNKKTTKFFLRSSKIRQKIDAAVNAALKAGQIAQQRADIALARAVNARSKAHSAELAAKQARADSEYARIKSKEVAPDFIQPGETKKLPEIILDIDRGGSMMMPNGYASFQAQLSHSSGGGGGLGDPVAMNSLSPDQFRKLHSPVNPQLHLHHQQQQQQPKPDIYMDHFMRTGAAGPGPGGGGGLLNSQDPYATWQSTSTSHQHHHPLHPHHPQLPLLPNSSSTPPQSLSRISTTNVNHPSQQQQQQFYDPNLLISAHQLQQLHSSMDPTSQKLNNEMLGLGQLDAQTLAQLQQQQQQQSFMQQQQPGGPSNKHLFQNYSFDEQLPASYYEDGGGMNHRMNLLQQAQSHSFNMDMLSNMSTSPAEYAAAAAAAAAAGQPFDRNNPRRNTLKRGQRVVDQSSEELTHQQQQQQQQQLLHNNVSNLLNMSPAELSMLGLSPQQHQQLLMMRQQQYSNNSSGQESGIGSSVYTNSAHGTHDLLINTNAQSSSMMPPRPNISPNSHQQHHLIAGGGGARLFGVQDPNNKENLLISSSPQQQQMNSTMNSSMINNQMSLDLSMMAAAAAAALPRRKSLPSIVKSKSFKEDETAHSSAELNDKNQEMFIIENGIRKRVCEKTNSALNNQQNKHDAGFAAAGGGPSGGNESDLETSSQTAGAASSGDKTRRGLLDFDDDETPQLPRKIVLESINNLDLHSTSSNSKRVSMPSIPAYLNPKFASKVMSREEANRLSSLRREELRQNRELESNRSLRLKNMLKNDTISMFFKTTADCCIQTDDEEYSSWIKNVFLRNRLFLFIILFNISLAIWFLQMLK